MSRIKPATGGDKAAIAEAIGSLRDARTLLRKAGADRACKAATRALKSAEGARRHVQHRIIRSAT
jgi:hypothetical protein